MYVYACVCAFVCSGRRLAGTCVHAGVLLHAAAADEGLAAVAALELLGVVVQRAVHLQAVLVGERLAAHLAAVRPHARVVQHVDAQRVQLGQRLAADVADELPLGAHARLVVRVAALVGPEVGGGGGGGRGLEGQRPLATVLLVAGEVGPQRGGVLELLTAQLQRQSPWS